MCRVLSHEPLNSRVIDFDEVPFGKFHKLRFYTTPLGFDLAVLCYKSVDHHLHDGLLLARLCIGKDCRK